MLHLFILLPFRCNGYFNVFIKKLVKSNASEDEYHHFATISSGTNDCLDDDKISYATQASEGTLVLSLPGEQSGQTVQVEGDIIRHSYLYNNITVGFSKNMVDELHRNLPFLEIRQNKFKDVHVKFILKYSYFDSLHDAVEKIPDEVVQKILPLSTKDFPLANEEQQVDLRVFPQLRDTINLDLFNRKETEAEEKKVQIPGSQMKALHKILSAESSGPPVLIAGSFGSGKTRVLARAAFQVLKNNKSAKVLICVHHQASADALITNYFGVMKEQGWHCGHMVRLIPIKEDNRNSRYHRTVSQIKNIQKDSQTFRLVITTSLTSLHLREKLGNSHFTHIFIDEGAQTREPETIAPLCLANKNTKIVIAGDHKQVFKIMIITVTQIN